MPYILQELRRYWKRFLVQLLAKINGTTSVGELNYIITMILLKARGKNPNYERYNALMGVLKCCGEEFYRMRIVPYEKQKIAENCDVEGDLASMDG